MTSHADIASVTVLYKYFKETQLHAGFTVFLAVLRLDQILEIDFQKLNCIYQSSVSLALEIDFGMKSLQSKLCYEVIQVVSYISHKRLELNAQFSSRKKED